MADNLLLQQLQGVRAFIMYHIVPQANGDIDKVPVNPQSGYSCSPHDPNEWMTPEQAFAWANRYGPSYGVGVVISEDIVLPNGLKLFCLDLDKCRDGNQWLPHAANFCQRFPGALVECSVSNNGLHVFACYQGTRPDHGVKNRTYRMELYTKLRFIAVTGFGAVGNALIDHTHALDKIAKEYFPPHDDEEYAGILTDKPVSEWSGPEDDDLLLAKALRSQSGAVVFGGRASFSDLFNANADVLAKVFPPFKGTKYDESAADQALSNHLAFWTGNHGKRIERLMRASKLVREKWNARPGYLVNTINRACGSQKQWYKDPRAVAESPQFAPVVDPLTIAAPLPSHELTIGAISNSLPQRPTIGELLTVHEQMKLFEGCVYVQDVHQIMMPQGQLLSSERFDAEFSGYTFMTTRDGTRPAKKAWEAFVHSELYAFPKVRGAYFNPKDEPRNIMQKEGWTFINSWVPIEVRTQQGDPSPFLNHIKKILPRDNDADILLTYFKAAARFKGDKFQWWPLIQGLEGNGKTLLSKLLETAVGKRYTHWPKASEIGSKFNAAYYGKLLILVEDVKITDASQSLWETLKPMITGEQLEIEAKGVDQVMRDVCFNGVLNSNHKNAIRKTRNDRRICPFFCAQQYEADLIRDGMDEPYFIWFRDWIKRGGSEIVAHYLLTDPIHEQWNPAGTALRAPKTTATEEAISVGLGNVEQEVLEAIDQGMHGFKGGWVSSTALDRLLATLGKSNTVPRNRRRDLIESLGFIRHPKLPEGRVPANDTDGTRPVLFVRPGADGSIEENPYTVLAWYQHAQK